MDLNKIRFTREIHDDILIHIQTKIDNLFGCGSGCIAQTVLLNLDVRIYNPGWDMVRTCVIHLCNVHQHK